MSDRYSIRTRLRETKAHHGRLRSRTFRDPIYGDIQAGPLQSEIIDTELFQRLRYIRQNGLLHFVFPGAVHTRFAHSLGTMHLAQRVFDVLFPQHTLQRVRIRTRTPSPQYYLRTVFETSALLHDVGHCAFSHSLERIKMAGEPFLYPVQVLAEAWREGNESDLSPWQGQDLPSGSPTHEHIGLLMIGKLFYGQYPRVSDACHRVLKVEPVEFARDVRAMLEPKLSPSQRFVESATEVSRTHPGLPSRASGYRSDDILAALHTLISGTLDVDRLDYLVRDSFYAGVPYGLCDVDVLVNSLCLGCDTVSGDRVVLSLHSRATRALDDLLWSRYQLFCQVLNHGANVMLNAMLAEAIPAAVEAGGVHLKRPKAFVDFLEFTDDHVLAAVWSTCLRQAGARETAYARALVRRQLPLHLEKIDLRFQQPHNESGIENEERGKIDEKKRFWAKKLLGGQDHFVKINDWEVESALLKGGGMPHVMRRLRHENRYVLEGPATPGNYRILDWNRARSLPASETWCHLFVDRGLLRSGQGGRSE